MTTVWVRELTRLWPQFEWETWLAYDHSLSETLDSLLITVWVTVLTRIWPQFEWDFWLAYDHSLSESLDSLWPQFEWESWLQYNHCFKDRHVQWRMYRILIRVQGQTQLVSFAFGATCLTHFIVSCGLLTPFIRIFATGYSAGSRTPMICSHILRVIGHLIFLSHSIVHMQWSDPEEKLDDPNVSAASPLGLVCVIPSSSFLKNYRILSDDWLPACGW